MGIFLLYFIIISCSSCDPVIPTVTSTFKGAILHTLWCGPTSSPTFLVLTSQGEVFRSIDFGVKFDVIHQPFGPKNPNPRPIAVKSIEKSPLDNSLVFFLGATNELWVSEDCGEGLMEILTAGTIIDVKPHPLERTWVLVSTLGNNNNCGVDSSESSARCKNLYFSKRLGQNLKEIRDQVVDFSWGIEDISYLENVPISRIYVCSYGRGFGLSDTGLQRGKWSKSIDLYYSDNFFKNQTKVMAGGNRFLLKEKRIFVVKAINEATQEVGLFIGKAHRRNIELKAIELPVKHLGQYSYSILDITRESIIIQIKHQGAQSQLPLGNIYVINRKTLVSSLSLLNNLINNNGVPQFEKIEGIPGIYVANALQHDKAELLEKEIAKNTKNTNIETSNVKLLEKYIKTYITYDYGGRWHSIDLRGSCNLDCGLNLNIRTFSDKGPVYSKSTALGLILATGNKGSYLTHRNISTFYSLDGGNEWMFLGEGSHTYDFGDHGGLIVIGSTDSETDRIRYSWTSWKTWETAILPGNLSIFNIMTEEDNRGLHFMILGQSSSNPQENLIISLDFNALNKRPCLRDSDYEVWSPFNAHHCVLGTKTLFLKRKSDADCVNGLEFERPVSTEVCECTDEDWECDVGFLRTSGACERQGFSTETEEIEAQMANCVDFIVIRSGYRLIPGSKCIGGVQYKTKRMNCPVNTDKSNNEKEAIGEWWILLGTVYLIVVAILKGKNIKLCDKIANEDEEIPIESNQQENNTIFNEESL